MLKFIVMSDLHIVPEGEVNHGIDTTARLISAIEHINRYHSDAELCVLAGDLTDRGDPASYERFASHVAALEIPALFTLGNHDARPAFLAKFGADLADATGRVNHVRDVGGYRLIVLDTLLEGKIEGDLSAEQLAWLAEKLAEAQDRPVIVVLHHVPCDLGVAMDAIKLVNGKELANVLGTHGDVRHVITGHVHKTTSGVFHGVPFTTICGNHYNLTPRLVKDFMQVPRREGPGHIGVVLAGPETVVVHHESFFDQNAEMPMELFEWSGPPEQAFD